MSRFGLMLDRALSPDKIPVLVDLGSVNDKATRDRGDALMAAGMKAKRHFSIEGNSRLLMKVPPTKAEALFAQFPAIVPGSTYWQTTHHWRGLADGEKVAPVRRVSSQNQTGAK